MAFDRKHYKEVKIYMDGILNNPPFQIALDGKPCPVNWAKGFFGLITDCVEREDYEGAKATRDSIIEFFNSFGAAIPEDARLTLPAKLGKK
jgi:hypothetical protein